jgi:tetratricopeptide (TPR) repeat protein
MADSSNRFSRFWLELKRRKTDRVMVMYAAVAFTIIQIAEPLKSGLSLPDWTTTFVIIVLIVGFPVAAIFSWFFDITPGGIEKTKPANGKERDRMKAQLRTWKEATMVSVMVIIALIIFNIARGNIKSSEIKRAEKTIAVLPFDNLTPNEILPWPTDVVTSIITTGLSEINVLQVCPRRMVLESSTKNRSISEIAKKLKVSFLVTGDLVNIKDLVLVNIILSSATKNKITTIWAHKYPFDPNGNITELNEIPIDIGNKLKIALSAEEKSRISKRPTLNTAAFLSYTEATVLQDDAYNGSNYLSMGDSIFMELSVAKSFDMAMYFYDKAIKADSTFALAYAKRAITRAWGYQANHFSAKDHMEKCRNDIEHAMKFDKNLTEAKIAYGFYYYYFVKDYNKALEYFREVSKMEPGNWQNNFYMALVLRAQGKWDQSQNLMREVVKYNPKDPLILTNIGLSYHELHQYDTAIYYQDRAIQRMHAWSAPYQNKIESLILRDGNTYKAETVLDTAENKTTGGFFPYIKIIIDLYNGKYKEALLKAETAGPSDFPDQGSKCLLFAEIYDNLKNTDMARGHYKSALEFYEKCLTDKPEDPEILSYIGISAAGVNDRLKALEAGQKAIKLAEFNYGEHISRIRDLAEIYVKLGDYNKSLILLEQLLENPSDISVKLLQIDPVWKPLQGKPAFKKMIEKYSSQI